MESVNLIPIFLGGSSRKDGNNCGNAAGTGAGPGRGGSGTQTPTITAREQEHRQHGPGQTNIKRLLDSDTNNRESGE